jgi:acyl-CoA thioesterase
MPGGRSALWARIPEVLDMSAATLAILGDYVPFGIGQALGAMAGGNSLDNTLRVGRLVPTEWVLLDIRVHAVRNGFGHGDVHLWADDGTLLATASQSTIVRFWKEEVPGTKPRTTAE